MARPRTGSPKGAGPPPQTSDAALSGYGKTKINSVGYNINNPYSLPATRGAKSYTPKAEAFQSKQALAYGKETKGPDA